MDLNLFHDFLDASRRGDLSGVEAFVSKHDVQDWTSFRNIFFGHTVMHIAAREGHLNIVRYLCEAFEKPDFKVDVASKDMSTPLHMAVLSGRSDIVRYLIEKGATVDALKRDDWTPLMLACTKTGRDTYECIDALLKAKANPFLKNKDGWTTLHLMSRSGDENIFNLLADRCGTRIDDRNNRGRSAIHIAAFHGHGGLVERFVALNANVLDAKDSSGSTPLLEAIKGGHLAMVKRIIKLGADVGVMNNFGQTILHVAALIGTRETYKYILDNNLIDLNPIYDALSAAQKIRRFK